MLSTFTACGGSQESPEPDEVETEFQAAPLETTQKEPDAQEKKETYDEITALYADIIPDAEISATLRNGKTVYVKIKTDLLSDAEPDSWEETLTALGDALAAPTAGEGSINPPTISKFEYDQISAGKTLSQVREIVGGDGTLESSYGTVGVIPMVQTYRFLGEQEGSYADILFDDYKVYSKFEFMLE